MRRPAGDSPSLCRCWFRHCSPCGDGTVMPPFRTYIIHLLFISHWSCGRMWKYCMILAHQDQLNVSPTGRSPCSPIAEGGLDRLKRVLIGTTWCVYHYYCLYHFILLSMSSNKGTSVLSRLASNLNRRSRNDLMRPDDKQQETSNRTRKLRMTGTTFRSFHHLHQRRRR